MIRAALFDLDETLFDRTNAVITCIRAQYNRFSDITIRVSQEDYLRQFIALDQHGYAKRDTVYEQLLAQFDLPQSLHQSLMEDWQHHYLASGNGFVGMHEMLDALKTSGLRLGLVTNGSAATQQAKVDHLAIAHCFDAIVISEAVGIRKPDPRIFQLALAKLNVSANEAVFIGDNPSVDIEGAQAVGMNAIWKRDTYWGHAPMADAIVDHLSEIPALIHQMTQSPNDK